ncbi:NADH-ubiquinone reductase (H(+)-translocating) NDE1 [Ascoidea rubescens DSM 1968]|uniref:NADH:ubiquinone reductase (non-electrogenic) n=1 Tax=Ascoidea rubescens DSM 1968 TaxID=1344418 RepID=A0A1D2VED7_9ASCO|nr:FAD/NAD(P)-binding domain-containing protein [Ascoidea rubescens DSM 1968]ODV59880.1 FAD/NAD(P)-binding domain-containing protein [Ascoidea rubescens DSM 1968]
MYRQNIGLSVKLNLNSALSRSTKPSTFRCFNALRNPTALRDVNSTFPALNVISRHYSAVSNDIPPSKSPSSFRKFMKYSWKFTWISSLFTLSYLVYLIYDENNPNLKQVPHDKNKKNLIILGSGWSSISLLKNLDTTLYNVTIVSPRDFFLFTPLLPSVPTGTLDLNSITEPLQQIIKRTKGQVNYIEAEATNIDPVLKKISLKSVSVNSSNNTSEKDENENESETIIKNYDLNYDVLVVGVGAKVNTFGIPGVQKYACYLKEASDSSKIRKNILKTIEAASILPKDDPERERLLSMVIVGGGPTGVEFAGELHDYIHDDLKKWMPQIADEIKVTVIEALPNILNMFDKKLIDYAEHILIDETSINLQTKTLVQNVDQSNVYAKLVTDKNNINENQNQNQIIKIPYGVLVWATGNGQREITNNLIQAIPSQNNSKRGLLVDDCLNVIGANDIFAFGDCTFTNYAPTAQVAYQQGIYLADHLKSLAKIDILNEKLSDLNILKQKNLPETNINYNKEIKTLSKKLINYQNSLHGFTYHHMGSLAYIGSDKAIADLSWKDWQTISTGGIMTFVFWRTAYVSMCLSMRNKVLVCLDWFKVGLFGRDLNPRDT